MRARSGIALGVGLMLVGGCGDHEFEPPDRNARVERAAAAYSPTTFDTIDWDAEAIQLTQGNTVYAEECTRCHGPLGRGGTDYARERNLTVPTLVAPSWPLAQVDSLRRRIFVGHASGMPVYGDGNLTPRQIDATAAYILRTLRPDVLELD
jgi:mono/diheme cytochrome c family protein